MNLQYYLGNPGVVWGGIYWDKKLEERMENPLFLENYGYHVYSQNDEDGIIQEIFRRIGTEYQNFVEFGVDKGIESNCHALLLQDWHGLWIEGRSDAYTQITRRFAPAIRHGRLSVQNEYVTKENINSILTGYLHHDELDLLSIDVDGNDWHIWNAIDCISPRLVIIEYNGKFPPEINWKMAYNAEHFWDRSDRNGASLKALEELGRDKGYQLVGTNICGINAFFVREDLTEDRFPLPATAENLYNPSRMNMIKFANGSPARNYIGDAKEGMEGVFEYYPDWNCLATFGFHPVEVFEDYQSFTMRERKGKLFVRFVPDEAERIRLHYRCSVSIKTLERKKMELSFVVDGKHTFLYEIKEDEGFIDIRVDGLKLANRIVPIEVTTDTLWIPDQYLHNGDLWMKGVSFIGVEFI